MSIIDFRSDTLTTPSDAMRKIMASAEVGDDVLGEDPQVNRLQEKVADMFGHEAALFVPSGTMSNQIAIGIHCRPGDEMLIHPSFHIAEWEGGGAARLWGVSSRFIDTNDGFFDSNMLEPQVRADDPHYPKTALLSLENTLNRKGGRIYPFEKLQELFLWTRRKKIKIHLDGARIWNAHVATQVPLRHYGALFDTISVCFSKGLGAPVGSMLIADKDTIAQAIRVRKVLGGGMRQVGILASACDFALDHNLKRLEKDHHAALKIAKCLMLHSWARLEFGLPETNIVWVEIASEFVDGFEQKLLSNGVKAFRRGHSFRFVTHLNLTEKDIARTCEILSGIHF